MKNTATITLENEPEVITLAINPNDRHNKQINKLIEMYLTLSRLPHYVNDSAKRLQFACAIKKLRLERV
jgi:hypothetical protein